MQNGNCREFLKLAGYDLTVYFEGAWASGNHPGRYSITNSKKMQESHPGRAIQIDCRDELGLFQVPES